MEFCGILKFGGVGSSGLGLEKLDLKVRSGGSFRDCICSSCSRACSMANSSVWGLKALTKDLMAGFNPPIKLSRRKVSGILGFLINNRALSSLNFCQILI